MAAREAEQGPDPLPEYPLALIRTQLDVLSGGERRVAEAILEQPYDAMGWSAAQLAEAAATSAATVVRACRRLGFEGLQELRLALARDLGWPSSDLDQRRLAEPAGILSDMVHLATKTIEGILTSVNAESFDTFVDSVRRARRVLLISSGDTSSLAQDLSFRLTASGRPAEFSPDSITQGVTAALLGPKDVCIALSNSGSNALTLRAAESATRAGAQLIAVTASPRSRLARMADVVIVIGGYDDSLGMQTAVNSVAFFLTLRALAMAVGARLGKTNEQAVRDVLQTLASYHRI